MVNIGDLEDDVRAFGAKTRNKKGTLEAMATLPDFELLPYKLPPGSVEPLRTPANTRIEVEGREVLLRVVRVEKERYVVFLRRDGQNLILERYSSGVMIWKQPPVERKLERIGRYVAQGRLFFPLDSSL